MASFVFGKAAAGDVDEELAGMFTAHVKSPKLKAPHESESERPNEPELSEDSQDEAALESDASEDGTSSPVAAAKQDTGKGRSQETKAQPRQSAAELEERDQRTVFLGNLPASTKEKVKPKSKWSTL